MGAERVVNQQKGEHGDKRGADDGEEPHPARAESDLPLQPGDAAILLGQQLRSGRRSGRVREDKAIRKDGRERDLSSRDQIEDRLETGVLRRAGEDPRDGAGGDAGPLGPRGIGSPVFCLISFMRSDNMCRLLSGAKTGTHRRRNGKQGPVLRLEARRVDVVR